mmetsp:Transcript_41128/g.94614  ORF Transcript_41128/g.94614 Transcript_41128/m.94614 type:complete len:532 (+) Transcript_41128:78-1673(+)
MKQTSNKIPGQIFAETVNGRKTSWRAQQKELKLAIKERLADLKLREADKALLNECAEALRLDLRKLGAESEWKLELYGSIANGFGTRFSDLDATCVRATGSDHRCRGEECPSDSDDATKDPVSTVPMLERLGNILRENPRFSSVSPVCPAKVPILKARFEDKLDVDLSVNNFKAVQNTKLLKAYSLLDERVRDLAVLVKCWAKSVDVCGAWNGNLSSYTFTLMVIYFMQVQHDVGLPYLPAKMENLSEEAVKHAKHMNKNSKSLVDLLYLFFRFYTCEFRWGSEVVCIRFGKRLEVGDPILEKLHGLQQNGRIHIEDPIQLERNLNCVLGEHGEYNLQLALQEAFQAMELFGVPPVGIGRRSSACASDTASELAPSPQMSWVEEAKKAMSEEALDVLSSTDATSARKEWSAAATPDYLPSAGPSPVLSFSAEPPWEAEPLRLSSGEEDVGLSCGLAGMRSSAGGILSPEVTPELWGRRDQEISAGVRWKDQKSSRTKEIEAVLWSLLLPGNQGKQSKVAVKQACTPTVVFQ